VDTCAWPTLVAGRQTRNRPDRRIGPNVNNFMASVLDRKRSLVLVQGHLLFNLAKSGGRSAHRDSGSALSIEPLLDALVEEHLNVHENKPQKAHESQIPVRERARLGDAAVAVVHRYEMWGKTTNAIMWNDRLGLADLPADVFARP
jgi:hypothetical protein